MKNTNQNDDRIIWAATRSAIESGQKKNKRNGASGIQLWKFFEKSLIIFLWCLKKVRWYQKGYRTALDVKLINHRYAFETLPEAFDNYKILHLTDLHLDIDDHTTDAIIQSIKDVECDICVLTGDFRKENHGNFMQVTPLIQKIVQSINAKQGIYATLGNHDTYMMVREFEAMGIIMLCNESVTINKNEQQITLTGIDDVHYYFTDNAINNLEKTGYGFKIALVHSPELYDIAADNNYSLYLCGHTHGGQICLPGGRPLIMHLHNGKKYVKGIWKYRNMLGYTSEGCGTSGIPVRFNSHSETTLFTLKRK